MIVNERYLTFINSMDQPHTPFLEDLYQHALNEKIPVIRRETQSFLKTFLLVANPEKILEIGTAVGFSAILMAQYAKGSCQIDTIENCEKRLIQAEKNIKSSGFSGRIRLISGDAAKILKKAEGYYDLIFLDASKGQYINMLPDITRLMRSGSILISDNVFQGGNIIEPRFNVERRDRTIYKRIREFLYELKHNEIFSTSIIPLGDGITLSVKL